MYKIGLLKAETTELSTLGKYFEQTTYKLMNMDELPIHYFIGSVVNYGDDIDENEKEESLMFVNVPNIDYRDITLMFPDIESIIFSLFTEDVEYEVLYNEETSELIICDELYFSVNRKLLDNIIKHYKLEKSNSPFYTEGNSYLGFMLGNWNVLLFNEQEYMNLDLVELNKE